MTDVPAGYQPLFRSSPFLDTVGPFFSKGEGAAMVIAFRVAEKHCNARGTVHGGMYATLADIALGYVTAFSETPPVPLTTAGLQLDYAGSAKVGDWVEARVDVQKLGKHLAFVSAYLCVGDERIVRASGTFLVGGKRGDGAAKAD